MWTTSTKVDDNGKVILERGDVLVDTDTGITLTNWYGILMTFGCIA